MRLLNLKLFGAALLILTMACSNQAPDTEAVEKEEEKATNSISGTITNGAGEDLILQKLHTNKIENIDTVTIGVDNAFEFSFSVEQPEFFRLTLSANNLIVLIVNPGDQIKVNADASQLYQTYSVEGSKESKRLKALNKILLPRDSVNMMLQSAQSANDRNAYMQAMAAQQGILAKVDQQLKGFINKEPATMSSLAAVQNLNPETEPEYYKQVIDGLDGSANGNAFYEAMKESFLNSQKLAPGSEAPEINLPQPNGESLALSSLRGQYVLIDFWASWCGPCRRENPNVVRMYNKYHDKGFEIYGVSLDKTKAAWVAAIEQDNLQWKHVSDLKFWQSAVTPVYKVQSIPMTYLIDPEGKIIAKNLRGKSLEDKLEEIFSN